MTGYRMRFQRSDDGVVYPVGLFSDINRRSVRYGITHYVWRCCIRERRWRALRNYFSGYLAEHDGHPHNAGRGWTQRAARRRVERLCAGGGA